MVAEHPRAIELERHAAGEGGPEARARLEAHAAGCVACGERLAAIGRDREAFLARRNPVEVSVGLVERLHADPGRGARSTEPGRGAWRRPWGWGALVAGLVAAVVGVQGLRPRVDDLDEGTRTKGGPTLGLVVEHGGQVRDVVSGDRLGAGDRLRFRVRGAGLGHVAIVSLDSRGEVSLFHPIASGRSARLDGPETALLPGAIELDDARGPERVIAVFSAEPLALDAVLEAGRRALRDAAGRPEAVVTLPLDGLRAEQASVWFEKE